jgi:hypothetical protein
MVHADTAEVSYFGQGHEIEFGPDPLEVHGVVFRLPFCSFPRPGLYWVEFRFNDAALARQPLLVR